MSSMNLMYSNLMKLKSSIPEGALFPIPLQCKQHELTFSLIPNFSSWIFASCFFQNKVAPNHPFFGVSHAQPLHYADCMVISSHDSESLVLLDCLGSSLFFVIRWPTTWIAFPETSSTSYTKHTSSNVPHYSTHYRVLQIKPLQVMMHDSTKCMGIIV